MNNVASATQMNAVIRTLNGLENSQNALAGEVRDLSDSQDRTRFELSNLRDVIDAFIQRDALDKAMQYAQTKIIDVRAQLQTEFGHYSEVRRLATGLLQATDAGIVSTATMRDIAEELMLTSPRYWLAPAVVGLAAWVRDDREVAQRAVAEAMRRDNDKTALFFALVLRRHHRSQATARWVYQYVSRQNPSDLGREFVAVLDAVATGALGEESRPLVLEHVDEWYQQVSQQDDVREAQIARWMQLLDGDRGTIGGSFTVLPQVSETWPQMRDLYESATVHGLALDRLTSLFAGEVTLSHDQRERVDNILDTLVTEFDVEELPARREETRLELVIEHQGDKTAADRAMAAEEQAHDERVDILTLVTNAAFFPDKVGASKGTQRLATAMARDWINEANSRLRDTNRRSLPPAVKLRIEGWSSAIDDNSTEATLQQSLQTHIQRETDEAVAAVKFTGGPLFASVVGAVLALIGIIVAASGGAGGGVFLLLLGLAVGGWSAYQYQQLPRRRDALREEGERRKVAGRAQLNGAIAETIDFRKMWQSESAKAEDLHTFVTALSPAAHSVRASDEQRGILR